MIHIWNTRSCFQIELTLFTVLQLVFLREAKTCLPKTIPRGSCTWNFFFSISFPLGEIKAFTQVWWYVSEKKQYWFVYAASFCHPSSVGKIKFVIEQKRLFLFNGSRMGNKKTCILVSPGYSNVRENHLDPQMAVKKPENWLGRILPHGCA